MEAVRQCDLGPSCTPTPPRAMGSKPSWVTDLAQALLRAQDVNVVVVDWIYRASFAYNLVVENYKEVALQISVLINQLQVRQKLGELGTQMFIINPVRCCDCPTETWMQPGVLPLHRGQSRGTRRRLRGDSF